MKIVKVDASAFFLVLISLLVAGGVIFGILFFRSDPIEETLSGDQVINTLFVIENEGKPLGAYVLMYYPATRRAAVFDVPGSLGLILQSINRVDRIDFLYDPQRLTPFTSEIEGLLGVDIGFSIVIALENLAKITDLIEGVDIFIPLAVNSYNETAVLFSSGAARLDGDKAGTYLTYRLPEESDDMPVLRRQRFFLALLKRLGEQNEALKNPQVARLFQSYIRTGMNTHTRTRLFDAFSRIDMDRVNIQAVAGLSREVEPGKVLIFPHWEGSLIKDIVRQTLSSLILPADGILGDRVFTVEVRNGTSTAGLAGRTAELLRGFGYDIISIGNADQNDVEKTLIIDHSGHAESARSFGEIIRCTNIQFETPVQPGTNPELDMDVRNYEYRADFILILGRDFNERYVTETN